MMKNDEKKELKIVTNELRNVKKSFEMMKKDEKSIFGVTMR